MIDPTRFPRLEERARQVLSRISLAYLQGPALEAPALSGGLAGVALMHATLEEVLPARGHAAAADACLERALDAVAAGAPGASFYVGVLGVAWTIDQLRGPEAEDANAECDAAILEMLAEDAPWEERFDVCKGLVGYATYALGRQHRQSGQELLAHSLRRLVECAVRDEDGAFWWTRPEWVAAPPPGRGRRAHVDLGLAHGTPGVIALLSRALRVAPALRPVLEDAVQWLIARRGTPGDPRSYGFTFGDEFPRAPARLGWCYGDLAVAWALLLAARACARRDWLEVSLSLAHTAAARAPEQSGVVDASLCHGAAGVAHMFARLFAATGDPLLGDAWRSWLARALDAEEPARWFAGYGSRNARGWHDDASLLTGAAGVALTLATALGARRNWDEMLLVGEAPPS